MKCKVCGTEQNKSVGYIQCVICGGEIPLIKENHYISRDDGSTGLTLIIKNDETTLYDTFDCPHCGCQNRVQEHKRAIKEDSNPSCLGDYDEEECSGCCEDEERCKELTIDNNDEVSNNDSTPSCFGLFSKCKSPYCSKWEECKSHTEGINSEDKDYDCLGSYDKHSEECNQCLSLDECVSRSEANEVCHN